MTIRTADRAWRVPTVSPNGEVARVLLAFLATAGLFYVNIMPALVDGLIEGLSFSNRQAGFVGSANVYGAALGAFAVVFAIRRVAWRRASYALLLGLLACDLVSMTLTSPLGLIAIRFVHGVVGGALVGIGFAVIARTTEADRTFGYLLTVQFGLGGLGLLYLPGLVPEYGTAVLFLSLVAFSVVTLMMLPFLDDYPVNTPSVSAGERQSAPRRGLLILALLGTFAFQAANMGIYAYVIGLGRHFGLALDEISNTLGVAAWIAIAGSVLVILLSTRWGRLWPLTLAITLTALGTWALNFSDLPYVYWLANVGVGITWAFVISYLLGMCSAFDSAGQTAALGGFASKMGLASGPMVVALMLGEDHYVRVVNLAAVTLLVSLALVWLPARYLDKDGAPTRI